MSAPSLRDTLYDLRERAADDARDGPAGATINLRLAPIEAAMLWNLVDAQSDAGACEGGNTSTEIETLDALSVKLARHHSKFKASFDDLKDDS